MNPSAIVIRLRRSSFSDFSLRIKSLKANVNLLQKKLYLILCLGIICNALGLSLALAKDNPTIVNKNFSTTSNEKLHAAKQYVQGILDADLRPQDGFYGRSPVFPAWKDQPVLDCASYMIARRVETKTPYFEDKKNRVVVVPVWAELLVVHASQSGGNRAAMDGSMPSYCAFEYERWSFKNKRFEKVEGFRSHTHYDEFPKWGESVINNKVNRWVAVDLKNRYVRFLTRVSVEKDKPYQLAPQFPVHYYAEHALNLLNHYLVIKKTSVEKRISLRDSSATGDALERDISNTQLQISNDSWAIEQLVNSLQKLQSVKPFEEIQP